jgi:type I restriction enzyme S subunit
MGSKFEIKRLDALAEINPKRALQKGTLAPFIEMASVSSFTRDVSETDIATKLFTGGGSKFANEDTILARITPCLENGKCAKISNLPKGQHGFGSTEFIVISAFSERDKNFIYYLMRNEEFRQYAIGRMEGTSGRQRIPSSAVAEFTFNCPPESVRYQIGETLSAIDDKIQLLNDTNSTLESIASTIFESWFIKFNPVKEKLDNKIPSGIDDTTASLFPNKFIQTELGDIPEGWKVERLENWLTVLSSGRRPKGGVGKLKEGIPSVGAESITRIGQFDFAKTKYITTEFFAKMKAGKVQSLDVLLYKDGGQPGVFLPRVSMFGDGFPFDDYAINEHVFQLRVKQPLTQSFLYFWLWSDSVMHELKHRGGKAAIPGINQQDLKELLIAIPSADLLEKFEEVCSPIITKIFNNSNQAKSLSRIRDAMLSHLLDDTFMEKFSDPLDEVA